MPVLSRLLAWRTPSFSVPTVARSPGRRHTDPAPARRGQRAATLPTAASAVVTPMKPRSR